MVGEPSLRFMKKHALFVKLSLKNHYIRETLFFKSQLSKSLFSTKFLLFFI